MVVLAHSFSSPNLLTNFICLFHMPLFFFLSGYCFKDKYVYDKRLYVKRSLTSLYLPFVITNLIFIALHNIFYDLNIYNDTYGFMDSVSQRYSDKDYVTQIYYTLRFMGQEQLLGGFWFLKSLFFARLIFLLFRGLQTKASKYMPSQLFYWLFISVSVVFCLFDLCIPGIMGSKEIFGFILLCCGYEFKRNEERVVHCSGILVVCSIAVCMIYAIYRPLYFSSAPLSLDRADYIIPCIAGCLMVYFICQDIRLRNQKYLIYIGSHTLVILALHFISFKVISFLYIALTHSNIKLLAQFAVLRDAPQWLCVPYTLGGVFVPLIFNYLYLCAHENIVYCIRRQGWF
jgi:fucose 4-O-acetylase-like acetyltransferase